MILKGSVGQQSYILELSAWFPYQLFINCLSNSYCHFDWLADTYVSLFAQKISKKPDNMATALNKKLGKGESQQDQVKASYPGNSFTNTWFPMNFHQGCS